MKSVTNLLDEYTFWTPEQAALYTELPYLGPFWSPLVTEKALALDPLLACAPSVVEAH
jgi:hypothetical protein